MDAGRRARPVVDQACAEAPRRGREGGSALLMPERVAQCSRDAMTLGQRAAAHAAGLPAPISSVQMELRIRLAYRAVRRRQPLSTDVMGCVRAERPLRARAPGTPAARTGPGGPDSPRSQSAVPTPTHGI